MISRLLAWGDGKRRRISGLLLGIWLALFCYVTFEARHVLVPFVSPIRGVPGAVGVAVLLIAVLLLNAKRASRLWGRLRPGETRRKKLFFFAFAAILLLAMGCRYVWTRSVLFPGTTPDGRTYLLPALAHPKLPLDEARPIAFPYLISTSLALFGHPIGILIVHNLLALVSATVLALAVRERLGSPIVALVLLVYMLFCAKNVAFEYLLLTEHLSRCVFALVIGLLLWVRRPGPALASLLAALTMIAVLAKPNALILAPGVLVGLLVSDRFSRGKWKTISTAAGVYVAIVVFSLAGYMTLQALRFGAFQITSMTGHALYWQVNLLTDLDGPAHPEVKRELRRFLPRYLAEYGRLRRNLGNWAVFDARTPEIERVLGKTSPSEVVRGYAESHGSGPVFRRMDRVFLDLALEGIRAHPWRYLKMSLRSTVALIWHGLTFSYSVMPTEDTNVDARAEFFRSWSIVAGAKSEHLVVPAGFHSANPRSAVVLAPEAVSRLFEVWFVPLALVAVGLFAWIAGAVQPEPLDAEKLRLLAPAAVTIGCYALLCGFILNGEPPRFLLVVQDLLVLLALTLLAMDCRSLSRLGSPRESALRSATV